FQAALKHLERALEAAPQSAEGWVAKGIAHINLRQGDLAKASYERGLAELEARLRSDPWNKETYIQQAYVLMLLRRHEEAENVIRFARQRLGDDPDLIKFGKKIELGDEDMKVLTIPQSLAGPPRPSTQAGGLVGAPR